jgi:hypothetical protein
MSSCTSTDDPAPDPKGAEPVAENNLFITLFEDVEVALDAALQVDQHIGHLLASKSVDSERVFVLSVDLIPDPLAHHADESGRFLQSYDVLECSSQFAEKVA